MPLVRASTSINRRPSKVRWFAGWLLTYAGVNVGWAFFAMDLDTALYFLGRLFLG